MVQDDSSEESVALHDSAALFGLSKKDLQRPPAATSLQDLGCRQLAFCLAHSLTVFAPQQILEIGGELDPCLF